MALSHKQKSRGLRGENKIFVDNKTSIIVSLIIKTIDIGKCLHRCIDYGCSENFFITTYYYDRTFFTCRTFDFRSVVASPVRKEFREFPRIYCTRFSTICTRRFRRGRGISDNDRLTYGQVVVRFSGYKPTTITGRLPS